MQGTGHVNWMLSAALGTLARAERMHQHFLKLLLGEGLREPEQRHAHFPQVLRQQPVRTPCQGAARLVRRRPRRPKTRSRNPMHLDAGLHSARA
jgi:hypothetical protein